MANKAIANDFPTLKNLHQLDDLQRLSFEKNFNINQVYHMPSLNLGKVETDTKKPRGPNFIDSCQNCKIKNTWS